ncbi:MAG: Lipopolysaccharide kinase (Kdo/WaaP) family protein [Planctomycetes bacterium ADurb.Bin401]|nr:MAG: Lipopolysaccharide kinase (Kdo/WaaP) family protein [Planctomycetes bacterium ADurb.Bin401]
MESQRIIKLKLAPNWKGIANAGWSDLCFDPQELFSNPIKVFKSEKGNITVLKEIQNRKIVVKKTNNRTGIRGLVDAIRTPKSLRNFKTAQVLKNKSIETAEPVAAFWHSGKGNIYVTQYIEDSQNLYDIAFGRNAQVSESISERKAIIKETADLLAKLHKNGLWHRDPKAGNFIVYKTGGAYKVKLVDLDGIKRNIIDSSEKKIRTLANLAKTLIRFKKVNLADLYRGLKIYCDRMQISDVRRFFHKVERTTVAMRLLNVLEESRNFKECQK